MLRTPLVGAAAAIAVNRQSEQQWIAVIYLDCSVGSHPNSDYVPVQNCVTVYQVKECSDFIANNDKKLHSTGWRRPLNILNYAPCY